jgi:hypothetical protein
MIISLILGLIFCLVLLSPPVIYEMTINKTTDPATSKKEYKRIKVTYR